MIQNIFTITISCSASIFSILLHIVIWRTQSSTPSNKTLVYLLVLFTIFEYLLLVLIFALSGWKTILEFIPIMLAMSLAIIGCYIASYPAIQARSPTFQISKLIANSGEKGLTREALFRQLRHSDLVAERIGDLIEDDLAENKAGEILITENGKRIARIFILWRALLKEGKGG